MTTCLGKSCSFALPRLSFVNFSQFMYLVLSLLGLRAGYGIRFLIIAYLFTLYYMSTKCCISSSLVLTKNIVKCLIYIGDHFGEMGTSGIRLI